MPMLLKRSDERMFDNVAQPHPFFGIFFQQPVDEILGVVRQVRGHSVVSHHHSS